MQDLGYSFMYALTAWLYMGESARSKPKFEFMAVCHERGHFQRSSNADITHPIQGALEYPQEKFMQGG